MAEETLYKKGYLRKNEDSTAIMISGQNPSEIQLRALKNLAIEKGKRLGIDYLGADGQYRNRVLYNPEEQGNLQQMQLPTDYDRYQELNTKREALVNSGRDPVEVMDSPEYQQLNTELEQIKNRNKGAVPTPPVVSPELREHLTTLEDLGHSPTELAATLDRVEKLDRLPNESINDWLFRKTGINPKVFTKTDNPNIFLTSLKSVSDTYFRDILGLSEVEVQRRTKQTLKLAYLSGSQLSRKLLV